MIAPLTLEQLQKRFGGELVNGSVTFDRVCTDTRKLDEQGLFVALVGENFDAHDFASELEGKVLGLVVEREIPGVSLPQWVVPDTTVALGQIGLLCREQFQGPVVAITGSCGKTTVKEMLAAIFSQRHNICVTRGNLNNQFGLPMTLFGLTPEHEVLILEMGANGPDDIGYLCGIGKPQITAVNNVMPAHVEGFGSVDGIAAAKGQIYTTLAPGSTAVINADDDYARYWLGQMPDEVKTLAVGLGHDCAVHADNIAMDERGCARFDLVIDEVSHPVQLQLLGEHNVHNALVAAGCAFAAGIPAVEIATGLARAGSVGGRLQVHQGLGGETVIDDSYNANPGSVSAAIELLAQRHGKKILVLGDMAELGADAERMHREMGELARDRGLDALFTLGPLGMAASVAFAEGTGKPRHNFREHQALVEALKRELDKNTTVLVKGSRSARMERVVQALTESADAQEEN
ncbi:UDP-N-acetylmuramoyl-tripeptide--D-alanyl-D-alanine ligase [Microbulbifer guangxiensis]|uniref:UDP-N-acetylmuramoyl-tripeptide--D-alanyl-D- alanine ligase n=1 Tax=Microbulbifer guangxiensis TaxID=2904249 RepID=UPI001F3D93A0|nr:UDP-N-acetylmuramoyl-tripeptide--D-alanyl-D-alanine ligase [Microbulbifer guangxiensis]